VRTHDLLAKSRFFIKYKAHGLLTHISSDDKNQKRIENMEVKQGILVQGLKKSYWIGKKERKKAADADGQNGRRSHGIVTEVLCGLDFEMEPGGFYAIMGKSGCGKSTLMSILCGLEKADEGKYFVNGRRIDTMKPQELAHYRNQEIGIVFQAFYLDETRSLLDNVAMPGGYAGMSLKGRKKRALELLTLVGLTAEKKKRPSQVSGGQQQRAAIARALMNHPAYLFLDDCEIIGLTRRNPIKSRVLPC